MSQCITEIAFSAPEGFGPGRDAGIVHRITEYWKMIEKSRQLIYQVPVAKSREWDKRLPVG
jgi:hypothetical protein